ncbi:hypothetical protein IKF20_00230 [Candidatus Saccharibacteria bacterium]|nr:hypothetical protein [Candidatus Saccharibacteria bacterium]
MEEEKAVYCDGVRQYYSLQRQKYELLSVKRLNTEIRNLLKDEGSTKNGSSYRTWLLEDIFVDHAYDWQRIGLDTSEFILDYLNNDEEKFLGEYLVNFKKLPKGITADQFLEALSFDLIFDELEGLDYWQKNGYIEYRDHPGCNTLMGIFLAEFKEAGGNMNLLSQEFMEEKNGHFRARGFRPGYYVGAAIDLKNAGVPVDLDEVVSNLEDMACFNGGRSCNIWALVGEMLELKEAGAQVDLDKLATRVKRRKTSMSYDGYLTLMEELIEAGLEIDSTRFAKTILTDLSKPKSFRNTIRHDHSKLIQFLANRGLKNDYIEKLYLKLY